MTEQVLGYYPSDDKYICPVCKAENIRGYQIKKHFQKNSDLKAVDQFYENNLANSDDYLENLMSLESSSVKMHTKYLLDNKHSSSDLPSYNSPNFLCQQTDKQEKAYLAKIKKLKKFIEPLKNFISENRNQNQKNLIKLKNLIEVLENKNHAKRLDMTALLKCEAIIKKMNLGNVWKCKYCDFSSEQKKELMLHIESMHHAKMHKCPKCVSELETKIKLVHHINNVHGCTFFKRDLVIIGCSKGVYTYKTS